LSSIIERYRPKTLKEFIKSKGFNKKLEKIKLALDKNTPVIIHGEAGIGKTTLVHVLANEYGFKLIETNMSDERKKEDLVLMLRQVQMKSFFRTLFLLDEADGINWTKENTKIMREILTKTRHPIFLTANELKKIPGEIKKICVKISLKPPSLTAVVQRIKEIAEKEGIKPKYGAVSSDVRNTMIKTLIGGEVYEKEDQFKKIKQIFLKQRQDITKDDVIWLLDNSCNFYNGKKLVDFIDLLAKADIYGLELLKEMEKGRYAEVRYPYFIRRASLAQKKQS